MNLKELAEKAKTLRDEAAAELASVSSEINKKSGVAVRGTTEENEKTHPAVYGMVGLGVLSMFIAILAIIEISALKSSVAVERSRYSLEEVAIITNIREARSLNQQADYANLVVQEFAARNKEAVKSYNQIAASGSVLIKKYVTASGSVNE